MWQADLYEVTELLCTRVDTSGLQLREHRLLRLRHPAYPVGTMSFRLVV